MKQLTMFFIVALLFIQYQVESVPFGADELKKDYGVGKQNDGSHLSTRPCAVEYATKYDGQVIYIESHPFPGYYLAKDGDFYTLFTMSKFIAVHQDDVVENPATKWLVDDLGNGKVTLQNMNDINERLYLMNKFFTYQSPHGECSVSDHNWAAVDFSSYPQGDSGYVWEISSSDCSSANLVHIYTTTAGVTREVNNFCNDIASVADYHEKLRGLNIYIPPKEDNFKVVATFTNSGDQETINYQYQEVIGLEMTNGHEISKTLEVSVGIEIKGAFSASTKYSNTWKTSSSQTWSKKTTQQLTIPVGPHQTMQLKQLVGVYGNKYQASANCYEVVYTSTKARAMEKMYTRDLTDLKLGKVSSRASEACTQKD